MKKYPVMFMLIVLCFVAARAEPFLSAPEWSVEQQAIVTSVSSSAPDAAVVPARVGIRAPASIDPAAQAPARQVPPQGPEQARKHETDWGNDIQIGDVGACQFGRLSMDHAANGDIYVAMLNPAGSPQDTCWIYRSTDNGLTWGRWIGVLNAADQDTLVDAVLRVGPGTNPWIYLLCHYATSAGYLKMFRMRADGSGSQFINIVRGDSVVGEADFDRNIETPCALFLTYNEVNASGVTVRLFASYDSGTTWTNGRAVRGGDQRTPKVAAGGAGYVYITWTEADTVVWAGRYTNNLVSPAMTFSTLDNFAGDYTYNPTIAGARTAPGDSQAAWILNRHLHAPSSYDIHESYSSDGGVSWYTTWWPAMGSTVRDTFDMRYPFLKYPYDYSPARIVAANATIMGSGIASDSVVTAWARNTDPGTWSDRYIINDHMATGQHHQCTDMQASAGGFIAAYRGYGSGALWFDYWWNASAVAEKPAPVMPGLKLGVSPNPVTGRATVSYALPRAGNTSVNLYDASGRLVRMLARGHQAAGSYSLSTTAGSLASGVYLLRLNLDGNRRTCRVVVSR